MAIHNEEIVEVTGSMSKGFDMAAKRMLMANLQIYQYQYPIKSTIRELVSNAVDAITERDIAKEILSGKAKVEDYYLERNDEVSKSSNFDAEYYKLEHLSDNLKVTVRYVNGGLEKDFVHIIDEGVGLGGRRLQGYFQLGYSTKRNSKKTLGKFGIGAKAGLSTMVPFYTVISRYNGQEFKFAVYEDDVLSLVPERSIVNSEFVDNPFVIFPPFSEGDSEYKAYYTPTNKPNGVEVFLEAKKHRKQEWFDAVKNQLMYFPNVVLEEVYADNPASAPILHPVQAKIQFEDEFLLISDNNVYTRPHLVINKVNYGYVDFQELELEAKLGNVGIKVDSESVSINPSRESIVWNEQTKQTIQLRIKQAAESATRALEEMLLNASLLSWIRTRVNLWRSWGSASGSALSKLSGFVDRSVLETARFYGNPIIHGKLGMDILFAGLHVTVITSKSEYSGGKHKMRVIRSAPLFTDFGFDVPVYLTNKKIKPGTFRTLAELHHTSILIQMPLGDPSKSVTDGLEGEIPEDLKRFLFSEARFSNASNATSSLGKDSSSTVAKLLEIRGAVCEELTKSLKLGEAIDLDTVRTRFEDDEDEPELEEQLREEEAILTPGERRKLSDKVTVRTVRKVMGTQSVYFKPGPREPDTALFELPNVEVTTKFLRSLPKQEVYYSTGVEDELIHTIALICRPNDGFLDSRSAITGKFVFDQDPLGKDLWGIGLVPNRIMCNHWGDTAEVVLMVASQKLAKTHLEGRYKHATEFFRQIHNKTITMATRLKQWYTAVQIQRRLGQLKFLKNFKTLNPDMQAKYEILEKYARMYYRSFPGTSEDLKGYFYGANSEHITELLAHLDKVRDFQLFVRANAGKSQEIEQVSKMFFNTSFEDGDGVDLNIWDTLQEVLEYSEPIFVLLNSIGILTDSDELLPVQLEYEIKQYMNLKGR